MQSTPRSFRRSLVVLGAVFAACCVTGCGRRTTVSVPPPAPPGPDLFTEIEPNDFPDFPDFVAVVDQLSYLAVQGSVQFIGNDIVDHIEFEAAEPMELDFYLDPLTLGGDVDVSIFDPLTGQVLSTYAFDGPEFGTLVIHEAGRPFQFVIEAFGGDSAWDLELVGFPYFGRTAASGDGDTAGGAETPQAIESLDLDAEVLDAPEGDAEGSQEAEGTERPWIEFISA